MKRSVFGANVLSMQDMQHIADDRAGNSSVFTHKSLLNRTDFDRDDCRDVKFLLNLSKSP